MVYKDFYFIKYRLEIELQKLYILHFLLNNKEENGS